jgi:hypothetical protein
MNGIIKLALATAMTVLGAAAAYARVQPQMFCWTPDVEFPVACDDDDDDDGGLFSSTRGVANLNSGQILGQERRR